MSAEVAALRARVTALEQEVCRLQAAQAASPPAVSLPPPPPHRPRISQLSADVIDSNPYSRLMALQQMGVVRDYAAIRHHSVLIVGIGGVGSVVAEMLTRCGLGRLLLFDCDTVQLANMNRLFFLPHQVGQRKVEAAAATLQQISPDTAVVAHHCDVTALSDYPLLLSAMATGSVTSPPSPVSLVLSCVDSYAARVCINRACLSQSLTWMDAGVAENAMSGHIQTLVPGRTACFQCTPPLVLEAADGSEADIARPGTCAASLPTTNALIAALLAHNALRLLLGFGRVSLYQGWGAERDDWLQCSLACNRECGTDDCRQRQREWEGRPTLEAEWEKQEADTEKQRADERRRQRQHESNEWNIELVEQSSSSSAAADRPLSGTAGARIVFEHEAPAAPAANGLPDSTGAAAAVSRDPDVAELLTQLRRVQRDGKER